MGPGRAQDRTQARVWMAPPRDRGLNMKVLFFRLCSFQRNIKGQQLKGKIVSEFFTLFHTFFTLFQNFPPRTFPFKTKGFSSRRTKEKKRNNKKNRTNRCCTLVVARLSSSVLISAVLRVRGRKQNPAPNPGMHRSPVEMPSDTRAFF